MDAELYFFPFLFKTLTTPITIITIMPYYRNDIKRMEIQSAYGDTNKYKSYFHLVEITVKFYVLYL
jgi:hypothetical protein